MRRLRYNVATSLDGFIAGPNGEYDWIPMDSSIDFAGLFAQFDTFLMGRNTYETLLAQGSDNPTKGKNIVVVSRTLKGATDPNVTIIRGRIAEEVRTLKERPGKDIWLFGGGQLFRELLDADLVDTVELAFMPIFLSQGIPVLPAGSRWATLHLESSKILPSGIVMLTYRVTERGA
jgi:dihydrofolate reductase